MPLVNVTVNQRTYAIACDEGEEGHLGELAVYVDSKVGELLGTVGQVGEQRLMLMAALLIADTHFETLALAEKRAQEIAALTETKEDLAHRLAQLKPGKSARMQAISANHIRLSLPTWVARFCGP